MYIFFFDYDGTTYFFGRTANGATTGFTSDISKARSNLDILNLRQSTPVTGAAATRASFLQAMVHREIDITDNGSVKSRNYFPESLIIEYRLGEPLKERSYFEVFTLKSQRAYTHEPNLEFALRTARGLHELAGLDPSKWAEMAEEAGYL